jgi:hypothetical protein
MRASLSRTIASLLIVGSVLVGCTPYRERLAKMSDDAVCQRASAGPGSSSWNTNDRSAVAEAMSRGLSADDCDAATRYCSRAASDRNSWAYSECRTAYISMYLQSRIDALQPLDQRLPTPPENYGNGPTPHDCSMYMAEHLEGWAEEHGCF